MIYDVFQFEYFQLQYYCQKYLKSNEIISKLFQKSFHIFQKFKRMKSE